MADTERLNQPAPPSDLTQRSDADIADWLRTVAFWASTVIGSPKSVKGVAVAYIEEAMRRLGRKQAPATDADIAAWQERHGLEGLSATDARACFEDAATLLRQPVAPVVDDAMVERGLSGWDVVRMDPWAMEHDTGAEPMREPSRAAIRPYLRAALEAALKGEMS